MLQLKLRSMNSVAATVAAEKIIVRAFDILSPANPAAYTTMAPMIGPKIKYDRNSWVTSCQEEEYDNDKCKQAQGEDSHVFLRNASLNASEKR